jgi:hypothetical protein
MAEATAKVVAVGRKIQLGDASAAVMVQRKMDNRPLSLRDNQYRPLLFEQGLATRHMPGLARGGQLVAALGHDLAVQAL